MTQPQYFVVLSNISVEPFFLPVLQKKFLQQDMFTIEKIVFIPYQECGEQRYKRTLTEAQMVIVWLNLEILAPKIYTCKNIQEYVGQMENLENLCWETARSISAISTGRIIWILFEDYFIQLPVVTGYKGDVFADELNLRL